MAATVQEIAGAIKEIVESGGQVAGSRLSAELKARVSDWSPAAHGERSLRGFVAAHVAEVVVIGRSGLDVVYAPRGTSPEGVSPLLPETREEPDFWRVWVSPNSRLALAVERHGAELHVVPRGGVASGDQVLLEPLGIEAHREMAKSFLPGLPAPLQEKLQAALDSPSELWWQAWLRALRGSEHLPRWTRFRREQLEARLAENLQTAGLSQVSIDAVLKLVRDSHAAAAPRIRRIAADAPSPQGNDAELRLLVAEAVRRMSISELLDLRLPLGIVLDALAKSKSR